MTSQNPSPIRWWRERTGRTCLKTAYAFDYMSSDAILRMLQVRDGEWVVYDEHDPKRIAAR